MKKLRLLFASAALLTTSAISAQDQTKEIATDLVCGMAVNCSESYDFKYKGVMYYFDSYDCRDAFKENPDNFVLKHCARNDNIIDPVCGVKVDITESYDWKYKGRVYHFHTIGCKESFKMNPAKFMKNFCAGPASTAAIKP
jgi:YHS domain-containing protein